MLTENTSQSLLVKHFYFSIFCNIFFYTQLGFIFCLLGDLLYRSQPYSSFLFLYPSERSQYLLQAFFEVFFCFLIIFSWLIFRHFYIWKKNYIKNDKKWFQALYCIITINFLMNHLISLESLLWCFKVNAFWQFFLEIIILLSKLFEWFFPKYSVSSLRYKKWK